MNFATKGISHIIVKLGKWIWIYSKRIPQTFNKFSEIYPPYLRYFGTLKIITISNEYIFIKHCVLFHKIQYTYLIFEEEFALDRIDTSSGHNQASSQIRSHSISLDGFWYILIHPDILWYVLIYHMIIWYDLICSDHNRPSQIRPVFSFLFLLALIIQDPGWS